MTTEAERRGAMRVKVSLDVTFVAGNAAPMTGRVENISRNGVLLIAAIALESKTHLTITFDDPISHSKHTITGEVVRSAAAGTFGVSFVETDDAALTFIRSMVGATA